MTTFETASTDETVALGVLLARMLPSPAVVLLIGELGAGKTTLAKGIVQGLGAAMPDDVASPTFPIVHEFEGGVYHIDLYRLENEREAAGLGLDEIFERARMALVEWGDRFPDLIPAERVEIRITADNGGRRFDVQTISSLPK